MVKDINTTQIERVVDRAVAGDVDALACILVAHQPRIHHYVAGHLPKPLARTISPEDVVQDVFIAASQRISQFERNGDDCFYRWLVTIARHQMTDLLRHHRAKKRGGNAQVVELGTHSGSVVDLLALLELDTHTPSQSVAGHEAIIAVKQAVCALDEDQRQALELRYFEGLSPAEIAARMQRTVRSIHNLCHRGLGKLRILMGTRSRYV